MLVQHQLIGLSVCQSGRFFLSSLQPIYPVSSQVSINLQRFIFVSDLLSFSLIAWLSFLIQCSIFLISSFFLLAVCPILIIQPPLVSVPSCGKKNFSKFSSWIPDAELILIRSKLPALICDAKQVGFVESGRAGFVMRSISKWNSNIH